MVQLIDGEQLTKEEKQLVTIRNLKKKIRELELELGMTQSERDEFQYHLDEYSRLSKAEKNKIIRTDEYRKLEKENKSLKKENRNLLTKLIAIEHGV